MAWKNNEPDPLAARRRQLAEQERLLAEQRKRLSEELQQTDETSTLPKRLEPPVWRMEDEPSAGRHVELTPARKRNLAHQRRRDLIIFLGCVILLLVVVIIVLWVAYVHNIAPSNGT